MKKNSVSMLKSAGIFLLFFPLFFAPPALGAPSLNSRLAAFYASDLDHGYFLPRVQALAGLGHLGPEAAGEVSLILVRYKKAPPFEHLLALWALARIGTPEALSAAQAEAGAEEARLQRGSLAETAARVAYLAALPGKKSRRGKLDRALPQLYNAARNGNLEDRLLAAWALYGVDTPVTNEVADGSMRAAASRLDPGRGNYTRYLTLIRLVGLPGADFMTAKLVQIAEHHDFGADFFAKRARTVFTLAALTSAENPQVEAFRQALSERLGSILDHSQALQDVLALGPYACTPQVVDKLRILAGKEDESDRSRSRKGLQFCGASP
jgi:hypothetical protein